MELKGRIAKAQEHYQKYADAHCSLAPLLKIGNCVCQSQILLHHPTVEETFQEEPWSIQSNHNPWVTLIHSLPTGSFPLHPPHLPHIPTRTSTTGPISTTRPTPATSSRDQR